MSAGSTINIHSFRKRNLHPLLLPLLLQLKQAAFPILGATPINPILRSFLVKGKKVLYLAMPLPRQFDSRETTLSHLLPRASLCIPNPFLPGLPWVPAPATYLPFISHWLYTSFFPFPYKLLDIKVRSELVGAAEVQPSRTGLAGNCSSGKGTNDLTPVSSSSKITGSL